MSLASALNILRPALPYSVVLTKYDLLHLNTDAFEFRPHAAAPPLAVEMARTVFALGASSCIESYVMSRMLSEGPKVFAFDALTCEALENFDLSVSTADYLQPFPSVVIELPADYTRQRVVPFDDGTAGSSGWTTSRGIAQNGGSRSASTTAATRSWRPPCRTTPGTACIGSAS